MLLFCLHFNLVVLQPVVGGGKEVENVFCLERDAEASSLPAPGRCCCPTALCSLAPGVMGGPKHRTAPWVLGSQKHGSRRDSALNPVLQVKWQPAAEAGAGGSLAGIETNEAALFSVTPRN